MRPLHAGTGSGVAAFSFGFGAGTPAFSPACSSRFTMSWVSSQIRNRFLTRLSTATTTLDRYSANEGSRPWTEGLGSPVARRAVLVAWNGMNWPLDSHPSFAQTPERNPQPV